MVFKSLDGYFYRIPEMYMRGGNLVGYLFLKEGLLEDITSFIICYMVLGILSSSCEFVKEFLDSFVDTCV